MFTVFFPWKSRICLVDIITCMQGLWAILLLSYPYCFHCSFFLLSTTGTLLPQDVCNCDLLFLESLCFRHLHRSCLYILQVCVQKSLYECGLHWPPSLKYFYSRIFCLPFFHFIFMVLISHHYLFKIQVLPHNF